MSSATNAARPRSSALDTSSRSGSAVGAASRPHAISAGIALAEKAIALGPNEPVGYMQLGNLVQLQGHHERAIALRERAVRLAPSDFAALCGFGSVLLRAGHPTRALS